MLRGLRADAVPGRPGRTGAFGGWRVGGDVRPVCDAPAAGLQPVEGGLLDVGFGEGGHCGSGIILEEFVVHPCRSDDVVVNKNPVINNKTVCCY